MVLFDSSYLKIEFRNLPCRHLVISWTGLPISELFQHGIKTILKCCEENEVRKLLSDIRYQEQLSSADERFAEDAINEHGARHGMMYQAVILSTEVFLRFDCSHLALETEKTFHVRQFFGNESDATTWLHEVDLLSD